MAIWHFFAKFVLVFWWTFVAYAGVRVVKREVRKTSTLQASLVIHLTSSITFVLHLTPLLSGYGSLLKFFVRRSGCLNPTLHYSTAAQPQIKQLP